MYGAPKKYRVITEIDGCKIHKDIVEAKFPQDAIDIVTAKYGRIHITCLLDVQQEYLEGRFI